MRKVTRTTRIDKVALVVEPPVSAILQLAAMAANGEDAPASVRPHVDLANGIPVVLPSASILTPTSSPLPRTYFDPWYAPSALEEMNIDVRVKIVQNFLRDDAADDERETEITLVLPNPTWNVDPDNVADVAAAIRDAIPNLPEDFPIEKFVSRIVGTASSTSYETNETPPATRTEEREEATP